MPQPFTDSTHGFHNIMVQTFVGNPSTASSWRQDAGSLWVAEDQCRMPIIHHHLMKRRVGIFKHAGDKISLWPCMVDHSAANPIRLDLGILWVPGCSGTMLRFHTVFSCAACNHIHLKFQATLYRLPVYGCQVPDFPCPRKRRCTDPQPFCLRDSTHGCNNAKQSLTHDMVL